MNLLNYFKNLLIVKNCSSNNLLDLTQTTEMQMSVLKKQAEKLETHQIVFLIERTSHYISELKVTTNQHLWLEVAMIDLANLTENTKLIDLHNRITKLEGGEVVEVATQNYKTPPLPVQKPSMKPAGMVSLQAMPPISKLSETVVQNIQSDKTLNTENFETGNETVVPKEVNAEDKDSVKPDNTIEKDDFAPMPMSSTSVKTDNIGDLWKSLLEKISSVATRQLLLQLAKPVEITSESVVITMKSESFIKQLNESSKKQTLIDAVNLLFNQSNSNVIIRLPQASDVQATAKTAPIAKESSSGENVKQKESDSDLEKNNEEKFVVETKDVFKPTAHPEMVEVVEVTEVKKASDVEMISDQAKMIKDLFDGKIVE